MSKKHLAIPNQASLQDFVFSKIVTAADDVCWGWSGGKNGDGYPCVYLLGKQFRVSRVVYAYTFGDPGCKLVRHTCDNPACCNPSHLRTGTTQDNVNDKVQRGRAKGARPGEQHHNAKLTDQQVAAIRDSPNGYGTGIALARKYSVSQACISNIRSGIR